MVRIYGTSPSARIGYRKGPILTVVASDSSQISKGGADLVCDGKNDNVEIQAVIDALP